MRKVLVVKNIENSDILTVFLNKDSTEISERLIFSKNSGFEEYDTETLLLKTRPLLNHEFLDEKLILLGITNDTIYMNEDVFHINTLDFLNKNVIK